MSLELLHGVKVLNPVPVDAKYLNGEDVYTGITQVNSLIPQTIRHIGLSVNINNEEYWYESGVTDSDLVLKNKTQTNIVHVDIVSGTTTGFTATTNSHLISDYSANKIWLPSNPLVGHVIIIADSFGDAGTTGNEITIYGNGKNIGGDTTASINTNYGSIHLIFDGEKWISISNL